MATYTAPVEDGKLVYDYQKLKNEKEKTDKTETGSKLGYDQFLTLLCAEMQYQDPLEPTSNTEYVAQLATFSQLEATLSLQTTEQSNMANALVGKYVILDVSDSAGGKASYVDGKVDYVMHQPDGSVMLSVNNQLYPLENLDTVADSEYYEAEGMAKTITNMLAMLPDVEDITLEYEKAVKQIRDIYDGMTSYQQQFVDADSVKTLQEYEAYLAKLKEAQAGQTPEEGEGTENEGDTTEGDTKVDDTPEA